MTSMLRSAWGLEVDPEDPGGVGPEAVERARLPETLSRALDGARGRIPLPRRPAEPLRAAMLAPALSAAPEPLPFPLLSQYARFWREGVRTDHEDDVRRLGIMTGEAVLAALASGEQRWIDRAADGLMLLCELSSWCWVAHEEAHARHGWVVPDPDSPVVDLGAAQTLQVLAWADLALAEELDARAPGLRHRMRAEARRRVFDPYLARRDWHWLHGTAHNWTGWIHQHLIAGALFLLDAEEERSRRDAILALSLAQLDRYLASFPADGGIDEGFSYFWNGACRLLEAVDLLLVAAGGALDAKVPAGLDVIGELLRFPQRMDLGRGWFVNVADGPARPAAEQPWDVLHRWGRRLGAEDVLAQALSRRGGAPAPPVLPDLGLGRVLTALGDAEWTAADGSSSRPPFPALTWLPEVQLMVARERAGDPSGLTLAAKGGHNEEAHNHLDVGSCLVALDSAPVLIDLGQPTYTAQTFTERRYEIWTMTTAWHTLPTVGGHGQGVGAQYRARLVEAPGQAPEPAPTRASEPAPGDPAGRPSLTLELAAAYPAEAGVRSHRRAVRLHRGTSQPSGAPDGAGAADPAEIRLEDRWQLMPGHGLVRAHHVLAGEVLEHRPGRLRLRALSGAVAELTWDARHGAGTLERRAVEDPLLERSWGETVHRLVLAPVGEDSGRVELDVILRAVR
ncbi:heparinase II/III family protein [Brachybacterium saurashtrense]|uniref:Heparinase n=1 Tax=Brachybacterium saurashtrense TaxID=556288 RepID=A0A345YQU1_9MICO|nr:heparinase II/III family protein [Brachybacterium saurashtrense]AXK46293.1 heparinase [Brachybacterium saurashtrense]RRR24033.1 heparinase [Brachybacterium saurashtrense]